MTDETKVRVVYGPHGVADEFWVNDWYVKDGALILIAEGRKSLFAKGYWHLVAEL